MNFVTHSNLIGQHAILSPSQSSWLNYTDDKMVDRLYTLQAAARGTELHAFAEQCIRLKQSLPNINSTLNMYVNDAIAYQMVPEQVLYYSDNCFGTADAICFDDTKGFLRIHDLKTGATPAQIDQLRVYDALFCLEYRIKPHDIQGINRIYQFDGFFEECFQPDIVEDIIQTIIRFDKIIAEHKRQGEYL